MKIYRLIYGTTAEGYFGGRAYSSRKEAEKAFEFSKSIPDSWDNVEGIREAYIEEIEVLDKFDPWLTPEQLSELKRKADLSYEEWMEEERRKRECYEGDDDGYYEYLESLAKEVSPETEK